ncbi:MAG: hypothetical protein LBQ54_00560 [Planctomycetaceae bacterium]|nr:hypothetical protein [Planctomycetaceae bacterium]
MKHPLFYQSITTWILLLTVMFPLLPGCQNFPYKIDPSGNCLFVKNDNPAKLPAEESPFVSRPAATPSMNPSTQPPGVTGGSAPRATLVPSGMTTVPGISVTPGVPDSTAAVPVITAPAAPLPADRSTLAIPGSGPILLMSPQEQIALVGSEIVVLASYLGDDKYLRTGEKIEWSLDGVGHLMMTNPKECGSWFFGNFTKDQKISDRYAVAATTLYEGVLDRGAADKAGNIPVLAGQSWAAVQSAVEGTTTITAMAPTITDWQRRSDRSVIHWIDAEWIFPVPDIAKMGTVKPIVTTIKKRSSESPCPGWLVRYEILGGPDAVFEHSGTKIAEIAADENGKATVHLRQVADIAGTNTISVRIIRPAGLNGGGKRLDLGGRNVALTWTKDDLLGINITMPESSFFNMPMKCEIAITNFSNTVRSGIVRLPIPAWVTYLESNRPAQIVDSSLDGGKTLVWNMPDIAANSKTLIDFTIQANGTGSESKQLDLKPELTQYTGSPPPEPEQPSISPPSAPTYNTPSLGSGTSQPGYLPYNSGTAPGGYTGNGSAATDESRITITPNPPRGASPPGAAQPETQANPDPSQFRGKVNIRLEPPEEMRMNVPAKFNVAVDNQSGIPLNKDRTFFLFRIPQGLAYLNNRQPLSGNLQIPADIRINTTLFEPSLISETAGDYKVQVFVAMLKPEVTTLQNYDNDVEFLSNAECNIRVGY